MIPVLPVCLPEKRSKAHKLNMLIIGTFSGNIAFGRKEWTICSYGRLYSFTYLHINHCGFIWIYQNSTSWAPHFNIASSHLDKFIDGFFPEATNCFVQVIIIFHFSLKNFLPPNRGYYETGDKGEGEEKWLF